MLRVPPEETEIPGGVTYGTNRAPIDGEGAAAYRNACCKTSLECKVTAVDGQAAAAAQGDGAAAKRRHRQAAAAAILAVNGQTAAIRDVQRDVYK